MNQQEKNAPTAVEDLTVNEDHAEEVKGGAQVDYFLRLKGIDGEATSSTPSISEVVVTKHMDSV